MAPPIKQKRKPGRARESAADIAQQINTVQRMLTHGKNTYDICQALALEYGLPERTARRRIAEAREQLRAEVASLDRQDLAAQLIKAAQEILGEARETRQLSNALGALGFISRVTGIEPKG